MMEKMLKALFDFQKFSENTRLAEMISVTENRYCNALSDDDLENVNAAGEPFPSKKTEGSYDD